MYGKVFESIYDGTLAGHWQAIVTMQQLIVLSNEDGVIDMTPDAISRRTSIPLHIINAGLEHLGKPDPFTRTPGEDGKRIVPLDEHRPWGWRLVNHGKYKALRNLEQKREADRVRQAEKRKQTKDVAIGSQTVAKVAHTDTDADTGKASPASQGKAATTSPAVPDCPHEKLIALYHEVLPTCTQVVEWNDGRKALMRARWREKSTAKGRHAGYATLEAGLAYWRRYFGYVAESNFLTGRAEPRQGRAPFVASLEWLIRPKNFAKVIEGEYHR